MPSTRSISVAEILHVDARAGLVDEAAAQLAHQQVAAHDQQHADGQRPQRLDRGVGHHAVVDVHREHREREREHVDQRGGPQDVLVDEALGQQRAPEPVALDGLGRWPRCACRSGNAAARTAPGRCGAPPARRRPAARCPGPSRAAARGCGRLAAQQHAGLVALEQQQHGQRGGVDVGQRGALQLGGHAGAGGRAFGQVERQAAVHQRQAGRQRGARGVLAVQAADLQEAVEQRIGVHQVLAHGAAGHRRGGGRHGRGRGGGRRRAACAGGTAEEGTLIGWLSRCGAPAAERLVMRYRRNARRIDPGAGRRRSAPA